MSGIGVILNPHSRSNRRNPGRSRKLGFIVGDKGSCHETNTLEDVERLAHEFRERRIEILGISGGDGTVHATLTAFVKAYDGAPLPMIALLRGGTMNNTAGTLGILGSPEKILSNLILKYHRGDAFQTTEVNLLKVNNSYGFVFGMGVMVNFLKTYARDGRQHQTPWRAFAVLSGYVLSTIFNGKAAARLCEPFDATMIADGKKLPFKNYNMVFGGTIESLTLGFRTLFRARHLKDQFQFIGMSVPPRHLLANFPRALAAKPLKTECAVDVDCANLVIETPEPIVYAIDGDYPEGPVTHIKVGLGPRLTCIVA